MNVAIDVQDFNLLSQLTHLRFGATDYMDFTLKMGDKVIFKQRYIPYISSQIDIYNLCDIIEPYLRSSLSAEFTYEASDSTSTAILKTFKVLYVKADIGSITAANFIANFFLTMQPGTKLTASGHKEYVHYVDTEGLDIYIYAEYFDGTNINKKTHYLGPVVGSYNVVGVDVSPDLFDDTTLGTLIGYTVVVGKRAKRYEVRDVLDADPGVLFTNSFGCKETFYCIGTLSVDNEVTRNAAYHEGELNNYHIDETRTFKANTGPLSPSMKNLAEDMLRSDELYLLDAKGNKSKAITLTASKEESNNDLDNQPSYTFEYRYAQRNQAPWPNPLEGRIFDDTYDNTFN